MSVPPQGVEFPGGESVFIPATYYSAIVQGTWVPTLSDTYVFQTAMQNSTTAINDEYNIKVFLKAGTYSIYFYYHTGPNEGIMKIKLDGSVIATQDCYTAGGSANEWHTTDNIAVNVSGTYTLTVTTDSKNASSGAYGISIGGGIYLVRTS